MVVYQYKPKNKPLIVGYIFHISDIGTIRMYYSRLGRRTKVFSKLI
jgi:hypothetical protein